MRPFHRHGKDRGIGTGHAGCADTGLHFRRQTIDGHITSNAQHSRCLCGILLSPACRMALCAQTHAGNCSRYFHRALRGPDNRRRSIQSPDCRAHHGGPGHHDLDGAQRLFSHDPQQLGLCQHGRPDRWLFDHDRQCGRPGDDRLFPRHDAPEKRIHRHSGMVLPYS